MAKNLRKSYKRLNIDDQKSITEFPVMRITFDGEYYTSMNYETKIDIIDNGFKGKNFGLLVMIGDVILVNKKKKENAKKFVNKLYDKVKSGAEIFELKKEARSDG